MSDDGRATSRPAGLQRLIDLDLFPAVPVWRGKDSMILRDKFAKENGLACPLAYAEGKDKGYAYLALPSHTEFHAALHRSLLHCWAPDLPDGLQRTDAAFFEQLYGECRPYADIEKALPSVETHVVHVRDTVNLVWKETDGTVFNVTFERPKTLDSSRARPDKGDFKSSQHAVWPKAPPTS